MRVVIIGAGVVGLCSAYSLQRAGHSVTIIERRESSALETSFANGGVLTPGMCQPWNAPGVHRALIGSIGRGDSAILLRLRALSSIGRWGVRFLRESRPSSYLHNTLSNFRLARFSFQVLDEMTSSMTETVTVLRTGSLKLYRNPQSMSAGAAEAARLEAEGLAWSLLTPRSCIELEPRLARIEDGIVGGLHFPDDRSGDAFAFCEVVARAIRVAGGRFVFDTTVTEWNRDTRYVRAVRTGSGIIEADCFVICAGSYSRILARNLGIDLPIYPVKGYSLSIRNEGLAELPQLPVVDASLHAAIAVIGNCLRIAGTAEFAGFDTRIVAARIRNLESLLAHVYPEIAQQASGRPTVPWAGLRPMSADGVPIISQTDIENLYLNTGHGHLGWTLAAGSGELLAQLIAGQKPPLDPAPYSLRRSQRS